MTWSLEPLAGIPPPSGHRDSATMHSAPSRWPQPWQKHSAARSMTFPLPWFCPGTNRKLSVSFLSLLHLGIRNIYLGPTLPAFLSPAILEYLTEQFEIHPISTPENDLAAILA